jgi:predicted ferric reductase
MMPDLAFKCRCENEAFLGTITNCIERHSKDPAELLKAYEQLVDTCKAQGGKIWSLIDLVKLNENATNFLIDYSNLPIPIFRASLVWKAQKIHDFEIENFSSFKDAMSNNNNNHDQKHLANVNYYQDSTKNNFKKFSKINTKKLPKFDNLKEIERIGVDNILEASRVLLYNPVIIPDNLYDISYNSISKLMDQRNLATDYGYYIYIYWGFVILVAIIVNISQWSSPSWNNKLGQTKLGIWFKYKIICPQIFKPDQILFNLRSNSIVNKEVKEIMDSPMGLFNSKGRIKAQHKQIQLLSEKLLNEDHQSGLNNGLKKHKLKTDKNYRSSKFKRNCKNNILNSLYTAPVRIHAIVLIGYLILTIILCCINYEIVHPNTVFTCNKGQKFVSIADRTGIIGTIQLPIVYLFATRNNIFSNITGISYRTFQLFHKWTSRVVFVLLIIHCIFYLMFVNVKGDYIERWGLLKWRCANTAFLVLTITIIISFFKKFVYEFFKYSHRILLIIFSIGTWYHCLTLGWIEYLGIAYLIWGFEYLFRFSKIILSGGILKGQCKIIYNKETNKPESIRIVINHSGWWKSYPGCYCWIKFLKLNMFLESHPFTVVSAINAKNYNQLVFIIRVKEGLTKRLAECISKQPNGECTLNLFVEGPYGNNLPFKQYNQTIFVAGGVGFSVIYSIAMDLAQIYTAQKLRGKKNNGIFYKDKNISLVWVVPNFESLMTFKNEIESLINFKNVLEFQIFITSRLKDKLLQTLINETNLVNPFSSLNRSYQNGGFEGFKTALLENFKRINQNNLTCDSTNSAIQLKNEDEIIDEIGISLGNFTDSSLNNEIKRETVTKNKEETENNQKLELINSKMELFDLEGNCSNDNVINEQRTGEVEFLKWLIKENAEQISINFDDKPFLQEELSYFICKRNETKVDRHISVISCGPTNLNVDIRLSVVKCLENGCNVDYYEEELLW